MPVFLLLSCGVYEPVPESSPGSETDTIPPVISVGKLVDTAYLYTSYEPRDVQMTDGDRQSCNFSPVSVTGTLNLNLAGVYYLHYDGEDLSGNKAATVTRTVHVVENKSAFLNGLYNVTCTCTSVTKSTGTQTINTSSYNAEVSSEPVDRFFKLISMFIGKDHVAVNAQVQDSLLEVGFFHPDYLVESRGNGTITASGNTFTIESVAYTYSGHIHRCINKFDRKLKMTVK